MSLYLAKLGFFGTANSTVGTTASQTIKFPPRAGGGAVVSYYGKISNLYQIPPPPPNQPPTEIKLPNGDMPACFKEQLSGFDMWVENTYLLPVPMIVNYLAFTWD